MNITEYRENQNIGLNRHEIDDLIENLTYAKEPVKTWELDEDWKSVHVFYELLSRFWKWVTTQDALETLRKYDKTFLLFQKMFFFACEEIKKMDNCFSINMFLKDLSDPWLKGEISKKESEFDIDPSKLIFEILEYDYWKLDINAINNLIFLNEKWYKISIDDFSLEPGSENLSLENLIILFKNDIIIDYVKIDWKYLKKIFNWLINEKQIIELRDFIKFLKNKNIEIIWEWIWNVEEGYKARNLWINLFQWIYLTDDFRLLAEKEIINSKLNQIIPPSLLVNPPMLNTKKIKYNQQKDVLNPEILYLIDLFSSSVNKIQMFR